MPVRSPRTLARSLAIPQILPTASTASRAQITWISTFFSTNQDSAGGDLTTEIVFCLGVFNPPPPGAGETGRAPTPSNTAEWSEHWITADAVVCNTAPPSGGSVAINNFSAVSLPVALVEGVSLTGKQGYVRGVNRRHPDAEWLPANNPEAPNWDIAAAACAKTVAPDDAETAALRADAIQNPDLRGQIKNVIPLLNHPRDPQSPGRPALPGNP